MISKILVFLSFTLCLNLVCSLQIDETYNAIGWYKLPNIPKDVYNIKVISVFNSTTFGRSLVTIHNLKEIEGQRFINIRYLRDNDPVLIFEPKSFKDLMSMIFQEIHQTWNKTILTADNEYSIKKTHSDLLILQNTFIYNQNNSKTKITSYVGFDQQEVRSIINVSNDIIDFIEGKNVGIF
jgi:hypothetical protein